MVADLDRRLAAIFRRPDPANAQVDYVTKDGRTLIALKRRLLASRELAAEILRIAGAVSRAAAGATGVLMVASSDLSHARLSAEWDEARKLLRPGLAERLRLVILDPKRPTLHPADEQWQAIADELATATFPTSTRERATLRGTRFFEVLRVLLDAWLRHRDPVSVHQLMRICGCSYPTVAHALKTMERRGELARRSNRSAELKDFPNQSWQQLLAVNDSVRRTVRFVDETGKPDPLDLLDRAKQLKLSNVAIGGVAAARALDPQFNLSGMPRLDLSVHASDTTEFVRIAEQLNPALAPSSKPRESGVLALHLVTRQEPLFERAPYGTLFADPVDTLLDLLELKLDEQTVALIERLRRRGAENAKRA